MSDNNLVITATINPANMGDVAEYMTKVRPMLEAAGGELIFRGKITDKVIGDGGYGLVFIMRFKDADSIRQFFAGDDFNTLIEVRDRGFSSYNVSIADDTF